MNEVLGSLEAMHAIQITSTTSIRTSYLSAGLSGASAKAHRSMGLQQQWQQLVKLQAFLPQLQNVEQTLRNHDLQHWKVLQRIISAPKMNTVVKKAAVHPQVHRSFRQALQRKSTAAIRRPYELFFSILMPMAQLATSQPV